jgi:hypothetical protein
MPSSAPRQPAWAAPTTPAVPSRKSTGWQSAVRIAMARPGVAVTMASAVIGSSRRAVERDHARGVGLVHADQPVGEHPSRAPRGRGSWQRSPTGRTIRRRSSALEDARRRPAAPREEAMPDLAQKRGGDDLEAGGHSGHRRGSCLLGGQAESRRRLPSGNRARTLNRCPISSGCVNRRCAAMCRSRAGPRSPCGQRLRRAR